MRNPLAANDEPYEIEVLGRTLDQAEQQQTPSTDRDDLDVVTAVGQQSTDRGQGFGERTGIEHIERIIHSIRKGIPF